MRPLHIIMPMAGEGSRFLKGGYDLPKPLIPFKGHPLFVRAVHSLESIHTEIKYTFIVRKEHIDKYCIDERILEIYPQAHIFSVEKTTRGAVETCLIGRPSLAPEDGVIIMDCDLEFSSDDFNQQIEAVLSLPVDRAEGGGLVSFLSSDPRYSYAKINNRSEVLETAEKLVISDCALVGAYFFSKSSVFLSMAEQLLHEVEQRSPELYVSLLYNYMIKEGQRVFLSKIDSYHSYGTPEELNENLKEWK